MRGLLRRCIAVKTNMHTTTRNTVYDGLVSILLIFMYVLMSSSSELFNINIHKILNSVQENMGYGTSEKKHYKKIYNILRISSFFCNYSSRQKKIKYIYIQ